MSRILEDAAHGQIFKAIEIKIVVPGRKVIRHRYHAPAGRYLTEESMLSLLEKENARLESGMPSVEFKLIELAPNRFNFVGTMRNAIGE